MRSLPLLVAFLASTCFLGQEARAKQQLRLRNGRQQGKSETTRGAENSSQGGLIKTIRFNQSLLVCNAYPSNSSMQVKKNEREALTQPSNGIAYRECRYMNSTVRPEDRLDLDVVSPDVQGTFEVGALPASDAVLLLVVQKRRGSAMVNFQSFAFPTSTSGKEAQLALIDAFHSKDVNGSGISKVAAHLKMEDHLTGTEKQAILRRREELSFSRVYAIEEGMYDASITTDATKNATERKVLSLNRNQNYVLILTGDEESGEREHLAVFGSDMRSAAVDLHMVSALMSLAASCFHLL